MSLYRPTALAVMLLATLAAAVRAQSGPHGVGFRVLEARDSTRAFTPKRDWSGARAEDPSRPVQITMWYPAPRVDGAPGMALWEFRALAETETVARTPAEAESRARARYAGAMAALNVPAAEARSLWEGVTPAQRDAPVAPGRHPLVLHFGSAGTGNAGLAAELASHGYVVASFPSNGRMTEGSLAFTPNPLMLDTEMNDAGFVLSVVRRLPFVAADRLGVVTFSAASLSALLWQMRDMQADALAFVEGWERYRTGADLVRGSVHYDADRVRVPVLLLERAADEASPAFAKVGDVVDSLRYAALRRVSFRDALHVDFLAHPFGPSPDQRAIFETSTALIVQFLDAALRDTALAPLPQGGAAFTASDRPALRARPTEEEFYRLAETDPAEAARVYRETARNGDPPFRQAVLSRAAQFAPDAADRVVIYGIVATAYPRSVDARFRLGDALLAAGRADDGADELRAALNLIAGDPALDVAARETWRRRIEARLADPG
jgi:hypothetical protein